jgi:hypothetical protein
VDSLRLWKGWVFRGITERKYRSMKRALIVAATACFALLAVGTTVAAPRKAPPVSAKVIASHGLTGYPVSVRDALAEAYAADEAPTPFHRGPGGIKYG